MFHSSVCTCRVVSFFGQRSSFGRSFIIGNARVRVRTRLLLAGGIAIAQTANPVTSLVRRCHTRPCLNRTFCLKLKRMKSASFQVLGVILGMRGFSECSICLTIFRFRKQFLTQYEHIDVLHLDIERMGHYSDETPGALNSR